MVIQHNISAMNSWGNTKVNSNNVSKNLEKLSSGFKINRAGDNAAGLAISEKMRGQIRGLGMAEMNTMHGISLIQTAEGGLNETHSLLQRMRELAVQSSNGTYHDAVDRENIGKEYQALKEEIDRISTSIHYNGIRLLDGNLSKNILDPASFPSMPTPAADAVVISGGSISGTITQDTVITGNVTLSGNVTIADGVNLYIMEGASVSNPPALIYNEGTIYNAGTISSFIFNRGGDVTNYSSGDIIWMSNDVSDPSLPSSTVYNYGQVQNALVRVEDFYYNWGNTSALSSHAARGGASGGCYNYGTVETLRNYGISHNYGTVETLFNYSSAIFQNHGKIGTSDHDYGFIYNGDYGTINHYNTDGLALQIGANASRDQQVKVYIENMGSGFIGEMKNGTFSSVKNSSLLTQKKANEAINALDGAINMVSGTRADLGAMQNRLEHTLNNLGVTKENLQAAESSIRDVDMAKEMMEFTKNNILGQASQSMLTQANQLPQGVLSLLR